MVTDEKVLADEYSGDEEYFAPPESANLPNVKYVFLPHYRGPAVLQPATPGSVGIDLVASIPEAISLNTMGSRQLIPTGLKLELPEGFEAQCRPRSGLAAKFGVTVLNTPGTIDSDFRGEIQVCLVNLSNNRFRVEPGMRIAQIVIGRVPSVAFVRVSELSETERGEGGFGSTGLLVSPKT